MALSEQRKQQQRNRQAAKRKANLSKTTTSFPIGSRQTLLARARSAPFFECKIATSGGLSSIVYSKKLGEDSFAISAFLLDTYCLGAKDALLSIYSLAEYRTFLADNTAPWHPIDPTCAKKMTEEAVEYARSIGFSPHADFKLAFQMYNDIDSSLCQQTKLYGYEGKPYYISGPYDTPAKIKSIMNTLETRCGAGNYHYTIMTSNIQDIF